MEPGRRTFQGAPKPALDAFRLPLVAFRSGSRVSLWGLVRPAGGQTTATVEYRSGSTWKRLATVTTDARGYFTRSSSFVSKRRYRLVWTAPGGTTFHAFRTLREPEGAYRVVVDGCAYGPRTKEYLANLTAVANSVRGS